MNDSKYIFYAYSWFLFFFPLLCRLYVKLYILNRPTSFLLLTFTNLTNFWYLTDFVIQNFCSVCSYTIFFKCLNKSSSMCRCSYLCVYKCLCVWLHFQDLLCWTGAPGTSDLPGSAPSGWRSDAGLPQPGRQQCSALPHLTARHTGHACRGSGCWPGACGTQRRQPHGASVRAYAVCALVLPDPVPTVLHCTCHPPHSWASPSSLVLLRLGCIAVDGCFCPLIFSIYVFAHIQIHILCTCSLISGNVFWQFWTFQVCWRLWFQRNISEVVWVFLFLCFG